MNLKNSCNNLLCKIKRFINTITFKTLTYLVLFSATVVLLFSITESFFEKILYEDFQAAGVDRLNKLILNTEFEKLDDLLSGESLNNTCIQVYTDNILYSQYNTETSGCILSRSFIAEYQSEFDKYDSDIITLSIHNDSENVSSLLSRVSRGDSEVYIFSNLERVDTAMTVIDRQIFYILFVLVIFSMILAYFLSHRITGPIRSLTEKACDFSQGKFKVDFDKSGVTEIDELADTLNYMGSELKKTDEFRRDLMANVSHDLKTPLTMIRAYSEMVRDLSYLDKDKREEHLNIIIKETDRLNILVNDILALSKLQSNAEVFNYEVFDLNLEIKSILRNYSILKEQEGYKIKYKGISKALVYADKNKINQVIYNLVNNAINYTGDNKTIIIEMIDNNKNYLINIIDSGKGIDPDEIEYIWDKYYKKEKNHKRNVIGTGLGLAIVKNILNHHKFKYGVDSVKGRGSTFYFEVKKK